MYDAAFCTWSLALYFLAQEAALKILMKSVKVRHFDVKRHKAEIPPLKTSLELVVELGHALLQSRNRKYTVKLDYNELGC